MTIVHWDRRMSGMTPTYSPTKPIDSCPPLPPPQQSSSNRPSHVASADMRCTILPDYEDDASHPLPLYSQRVRSSECLLQTEQPERTDCPTREWIFNSKHMRINLGRRQWKVNGPAFGLNSNIDGSVLFLKDSKRHKLQSLAVTLSGRLVTSKTDKALSDDNSTLFLSRTIPILKPGFDPGLCERAVPFSIPFPAYLRHKGEEALCPPTFHYGDTDFTLEVTYSLSFKAVWKATPWTKSETKVLPVYYLPKTNPVVPPLCVLPPASRHLENPPLFLQGTERVASCPMPPSIRAQYATCPNGSKKQRQMLQTLKDSVYLSLPTPASFTSGQDIPFMLSLSFPNEPWLAEMLSTNLEVQLIRRMAFHRNIKTPSPSIESTLAERCTLVSSATIWRKSGWSEGMVMLKGSIQAGDAGCEASWVLRDSARVEYFLRVTLKPPSSCLPHIPEFVHEAPIEICTSNWGSLEREMASSGGMTTPAVSLAANLRNYY